MKFNAKITRYFFSMQPLDFISEFGNASVEWE